MAKKEKRFVKAYANEGFSEAQVVYVDRETGINYLFVYYGSAGGLIPLLDREGKPVVTTVTDTEN